MSGRGRRRKKSISFFKSRDGGERIMRGEKWAGERKSAKFAKYCVYFSIKNDIEHKKEVF